MARSFHAIMSDGRAIVAQSSAVSARVPAPIPYPPAAGRAAPRPFPRIERGVADINGRMASIGFNALGLHEKTECGQNSSSQIGRQVQQEIAPLLEQRLWEPLP